MPSNGRTCSLVKKYQWITSWLQKRKTLPHNYDYTSQNDVLWWMYFVDNAMGDLHVKHLVKFTTTEMIQVKQ